MSIPKYDELMKPLLVTIKDGKPYTMKEVREKLAVQYHLSEDELTEMLASGNETVFKNRVGWAKTYLKKAGLLDVPVRGQIQINAAGRRVLSENPPKIDTEYLSRFEPFREFNDRSSGQKAQNQYDDHVINKSNVPDDVDTNLTPDDKLVAAYEEINSSLASELLDEVMKVSPYTFEKMVVDLLSKMGYGTPEFGSHPTVAAGDDGIDGIIMEDKLGFSMIYMQAKLWQRDKTVGQPEIQSFVGAIAGKHGDGLFVTTAKFSQKAKDYAGVHHIILIDGAQLAKLMIEYNFCVSVKKNIQIKALDTDALSEYQDA